MSDDVTAQKDALRTEAKRARGLLSLNADQQDELCTFFFDHIDIKRRNVVGVYWPKGRELDSTVLIEEILKKKAKVALPVIEEDSRVLKFARWHEGIELVKGAFDVAHPVINKKTKWLKPDIFIVPLLAFDRRGYRLGYGGGYFDATLSAYKEKKNITVVGLGYAKQACLFNLPVDGHDVKMDWIITEQGATRF